MDAICNEKDFRLGQYLSETSKYANIEMTMVAKVNLPTHYQKYGANNHVYFISQDQMGRESQSKKKETRAIQDVDKWITRIEKVLFRL